MFIEGVEESFHLLLLHFLWSWEHCLFVSLVQLLLGWDVDLGSSAQARAQLEGVDTTTVVSNKEDGVLGIESNMKALSLLHGSVLAKVAMFVLVKIPDEESTFISACSKHS